MRNVELKARLKDLARARETAARLATARLGRHRQLDTYFFCRHGRLKLRETDGAGAQLIWYARPDKPEPRRSEYRLVPVSNPETLRQALRSALGIRLRVEKQREVFLVDNVRIHLDEVVGLGSFLEFEAVLGPGDDEGQAQSRVTALAEQFGIAAGDLVCGSYADLLEQAGRAAD